MHLKSALEPSGPESSKHYLILHHGSEHDLIILPGSYLDLEEEVKRLYRIDRGQFYIETDDLNLCRGKRVKIPERFWADIAPLLGNVYIVSCQSNLPNQSAPSDEVESQLTSPHSDGEITLNRNLNENALVIQMGKLDMDVTPTSATRLRVRIFDENMEISLTVSIFPKSGLIFLTTLHGEANFTRSLKRAFHLHSEHVIIIRFEDSQFHLLCDFHYVGAIEGFVLSPLTTVTYDLGTNSPFTGPVSAKVYSNVRKFVDESPLYNLKNISPTTEYETLHHQIIACDEGDATYISEALSNIRKEGSSSKDSSSRITWYSHAATKKSWIPLKWNVHKKSVFVTRITYPQAQDASPSTSFVIFAPGIPTYNSLQITITPSDVQVAEYSIAAGAPPNFVTTHGILELPRPPQSPGEHTIAVINQQNNVHVVFDFCRSVVFSNTRSVGGKTGQIFFNIPPDRILDVDVFEFDQ